LDLKSLLWHIAHPFQAMDPTPPNDNPQLLKTKSGALVILGGHHRLSALSILGVKKAPAWVLRTKDLNSDGTT